MLLYFTCEFQIDVLTQELSRQQGILAEITREIITTGDELTRFGIHLGFTYDMIQQTRTNHPGSVEGAALHLACLWWEDGIPTREEKVPTLLEAVRSIGKIRLVSWVEKQLMRVIEGVSVNVAGVIDQGEIEGATVNVADGIDQAEIEGVTVDVAGRIDQGEIEGASVMVVDETEERHQAIVPVRERFVGSENPTDV